MRLFLALQPSRLLRQHIADQLANLKPVGEWEAVPIRQYHLTLRFFSAIAPEGWSFLQRALRRALRPHSPFFVFSKGLCVFPEQGSARILALECLPNKRLEALLRTIDRVLPSGEAKRERDRFVPHITLGRWKKPLPRNEVRTLLRRRLPQFQLSVKSVQAYESVLHPRGPEYHLMQRFSLSI